MLTVIGCDVCLEPALEVVVSEAGEMLCLACQALVPVEAPVLMFPELELELLAA